MKMARNFRLPTMTYVMLAHVRNALHYETWMKRAKIFEDKLKPCQKKSPKFELLGIMLLDLNGLKDAQVESIVSNEFGI